MASAVAYGQPGGLDVRPWAMLALHVQQTNTLNGNLQGLREVRCFCYAFTAHSTWELCLHELGVLRPYS